MEIYLPQKKKKMEICKSQISICCTPEKILSSLKVYALPKDENTDEDNSIQTRDGQ